MEYEDFLDGFGGDMLLWIPIVIVAIFYFLLLLIHMDKAGDLSETASAVLFYFSFQC